MDRFYESKYCDVQCSILLWPFSSLTNGRGSCVVGTIRGSWEWVWVSV